ncbi:hypothetical protein TWF718_006273 [Orbilia javanica]|uniref:HNH nuclease domain-containing protein n=1 Tax=Orbilia javanica TaxID=47235 RepID=A0AAN8N9A0_9PEZI
MPSSSSSPLSTSSILNHISKHHQLAEIPIKPSPHSAFTMSTPPKIAISRIFGAGPSTPPKRASSVISSPTVVPLKLSPIIKSAPSEPSLPSPSEISLPPLPPSPNPNPGPIPETQKDATAADIAFQKALTRVYSASKPGAPGYLWCPVFKQYLPASLIRHFHIINPNPYYSQAIGYLFGNIEDGDAHFESLANGMVMAKCIANLVVSGEFAIIPAENGENDLTGPEFGHNQTVEIGSEAWKELTLEDQTSLLDIKEIKESMKSEGVSPNPGIKLKLVLMQPHKAHRKIEDMDLLYADIHNTILEFKSSFRPDLRYCYFRYISSILIWLNEEEAQTFKNAWKPKEKWLRESLVVEMARPERLANWEVYEEIVSGNGLFDDGSEDGDTVVKMDNGWKTTKSGEMAAQLEWGLLTAPDYTLPPHGHELHI